MIFIIAKIDYSWEIRKGFVQRFWLFFKKIYVIGYILYTAKNGKIDWLIILIKLFLDFCIVDGVGKDDPMKVSYSRVVWMEESVILFIEVFYFRYEYYFLLFANTLPFNQYQPLYPIII